MLLAELCHFAWSCLMLPNHQAVERRFQQIVTSENIDAAGIPSFHIHRYGKGRL
jgi:hypothetical protein